MCTRKAAIEEEEDDDDDYSRYSLHPNLSLFNMSIEDFDIKCQGYDHEVLREQGWLDDIFHSTKIEEY